MADTKPAGKTFFSAIRQFDAVPEDGKVVIEGFLQSCTEFVPFFDMLSSVGAFKPCKSDILHNISKIRKKMAKHEPGKFVVFDDLVQYEIDHGETTEKECACTALLWLVRAFLYNRAILTRFVKTKEENIKSVFQDAYKETLAKHHSWISRKVFQALCALAPYRSTIIEKITEADKTLAEQATKDIETYADGIEPSLVALSVLLAMNKIE